ncbi:hypothetical protein ACVOMV_35510 [Mesorhizobium atlanticum]
MIAPIRLIKPVSRSVRTRHEARGAARRGDNMPSLPELMPTEVSDETLAA